MNKEFVPYQESLELKELGFDEPCFGHYDNPENPVWITLSPPYYANKDNVYLAPLSQQSFRWFREKHNFYIVIIPTITMYWTFKVTVLAYDIVEVPPYKDVENNDYLTYEEAELAALRKLIEIVKTKTND